MRTNTLTITINKPVHNVFEFLIDPKNSPLWIDSFVEEKTNEWPARLGTVYRNKNTKGQWNEYVMTEFEKDTTFTMSHKSCGYHVKYTFRTIIHSSTKLTYHEWVDSGELDEPFTLAPLQKLKHVLETK